MKRTFIVAGTALALIFGAAILGSNTPATAQPCGGWGMIGRHGPGSGMMGGYGPGWMHERGANAELGPENCLRFRGGLAGPGSYGQ
jgi:hypothetical protein